MTESKAPRAPGPWDPRPEDIVPPSSKPQPGAAAGPALDKGQNPLWALVSTLLLGGLIWYLSGSWIIAVAAIWGLFVHEYGHVLAMNALGMGPARIYIIPFFGGLAKSQRLPQSEWHGVLVSLAGPAFGLLAAIPFFAFYAFDKELRPTAIESLTTGEAGGQGRHPVAVTGQEVEPRLVFADPVGERGQAGAEGVRRRGGGRGHGVSGQGTGPGRPRWSRPHCSS